MRSCVATTAPWVVLRAVSHCRRCLSRAAFVAIRNALFPKEATSGSIHDQVTEAEAPIMASSKERWSAPSPAVLTPWSSSHFRLRKHHAAAEAASKSNSTVRHNAVLNFCHDMFISGWYLDLRFLVRSIAAASARVSIGPLNSRGHSESVCFCPARYRESYWLRTGREGGGTVQW